MDLAGIIVLVVVGVAWFMWRRRAGRRAAAAQERIASVLDPAAPPGRYPKPPKGLHRSLEAADLDVVRMCARCSRIVPASSGPIGDRRWLMLDICAGCFAQRARPPGGPGERGMVADG